MADHVRVGVIHDDGVELALLDGVHHRFGDSCGGHFRLQIVGGHFRRRNQDAFFSGEWFFHAAIEKIGYVRVFFGFGAAQILVIQLGEDLRENLLEFFRGKRI